MSAKATGDRAHPEAQAQRPIETPWLWAPRWAIARIKKTLGGQQAVQARSVYIALCELSSERGNAAAITEEIDVIAERGCLRYRKTWDLLYRLADTAHVIFIVQNHRDGTKERTASTYVLLPSKLSVTAEEYARGVMHMHKGLCTGRPTSHADSLKKKSPSGIKEADPAEGRGRSLNETAEPSDFDAQLNQLGF